MKQQLDDQVREKERKQQREREQEQSYIRTENNVAGIERQKDDAKATYQKDKIKFEKEMRDKQMGEIRSRKNFETQQQNTLDLYILTKIKEELALEQQKQALDKTVKTEEMRKVIFSIISQ